MTTIYLIGSLRNPKVPTVADALRKLGHDVFDDWFSAGPEADDWWQKYENARGHTYKEALAGFPAQHVFNFDKKHIERCDVGVLVLPAGKSGHLELGIMIGSGKPGYILLDGEPERFDVMYSYATEVCTSLTELIVALPRDNVRSNNSVNLNPLGKCSDSDCTYCKYNL
jgi:hypothetical protein